MFDRVTKLLSGDDWFVKITNAEKFIKNVESLINPAEVHNLLLPEIQKAAAPIPI